MKKVTVRIFSATVLAGVMTIAGMSSAMAYSCKVIFSEAQGLIKEAETLVTSKTDSRIKALIAEAKGLSQAGGGLCRSRPV